MAPEALPTPSALKTTALVAYGHANESMDFDALSREDETALHGWIQKETSELVRAGSNHSAAAAIGGEKHPSVHPRLEYILWTSPTRDVVERALAPDVQENKRRRTKNRD